MNPDCLEGKHKACSGGGWDFDADQAAHCPCECHTTTTIDTADALRLARFMQAVDAQENGVIIEGVGHPTWEELDPEVGHREYIKDASIILGAIQVLGYRKEGTQ